MGKIEEYMDKARNLAEEAGGAAKIVAGDVISKAKDLTEEGGKARELARSAKSQAASLTEGAREKVQGMMQDARAVKEIRQGITGLEALPEFEGSILYSMELSSMIDYLKSLAMSIEDRRLDDRSVAEEIRKVMDKVKPDAGQQQETEEQQAISKARTVAYEACARALETLNAE